MSFQAGIKYFEGKQVKVVFNAAYLDTIRTMLRNYTPDATWTVMNFDEFGVNLLAAPDATSSVTDQSPLFYVPWSALGGVYNVTNTQAKRAVA